MYRRTTRRRAWLAGITAVFLATPVAIAGTAFAKPTDSEDRRESGPSSTARSQQTYPAQGQEWVTEYEQDGDRRGAEVLFTGPDDGWVIGLESVDDQRHGRPFVTHWDGEQWSEVDPAELTELTENQLQSTTAAALGPDDVWSAGSDPFTAGKSYGLGHWDGESWTYSQGPEIGDDQVISTEIAMERIGDQVWLTGSVAPADDPNSFQGEVFVDRLVDGEWERLKLPDRLANGAKAYDITGTAPDDVYVAAATQKDGVPASLLAHWDGQSWSIEELPTPQDWADTGWFPGQVAVSHGQIYYWGRPRDDHERLFRSEDGKSWDRADLPFISVTDVDVHPESGDLLVSETPEPFTSEVATFDGKEWTTHSQPAEIDRPSTALSAAYVPGTDRMVTSILLANSQDQPNRAKQYITTNKAG